MLVSIVFFKIWFFFFFFFFFNASIYVAFKNSIEWISFPSFLRLRKGAGAIIYDNKWKSLNFAIFEIFKNFFLFNATNVLSLQKAMLLHLKYSN